MLKFICAACAALFALAGCSGLRDNLDAARLSGGGDALKTLGGFAADDLKAALADADAHGYTLAAACWGALIPLVEGLGARAEVGAIVGGFSAFQRARDIRRAAGRGVPDELAARCAPLVLDAEATIARLGVIAAPGGGLLGGILR
jgi:hypothetical protein